jgi:hypothetical protein
VWGNSAAPEPEAKPRRLFVQNRAEQKNCLFLLEEFFGGARKSEMQRKTFCWLASVGERRRGGAAGFDQEFRIK